MKLGNWSSVLLKSILILALLVLVYAGYEVGLPQRLSDIGGFGMFALFFIAAYLAFSITGWLLFGFPVHWLICKYSGGSYLLYVVAALLFTFAVYLFSNIKEAAFIYGAFALVQALIFKYYVFRHTQT